MRLQKLQLTNFKNYEEMQLEFPSKINVLVGVNGSGKTNLLDAIYYLSLTRSAFQSSDQANIRHGEDFFFLRGHFSVRDKEHEVAAGFRPGTRKSFREDNQEYQKLSDHIGKYPVVMITPDDTDLVKGSGEGRRKFFDSIIAQIDPVYLEALIRYSHTLRQRNSLLKMFHDRKRVDYAALETYDDTLVAAGQPIYEKRKAFVGDFVKAFQYYFNFLVSEKEKAGLQYHSSLEVTPFANGLEKSRSRDLVMQRTLVGVHRDEYRFKLGDVEMKKFGSQGQQKSFVIALKLTQWKLIYEKKGFKPVLLLDDIFDKLDDLRIARLLELMKGEFGQLFITDARPDRTQGLLADMAADVSVFLVENGVIKKKQGASA